MNPVQNQKSLAIIGIGKWGKKLLGEFSKIGSVDFCLHQGNPKTRKWLKENYPNIKIARTYRELLSNSAIDAVIIATPIGTHHQLSKKALLAGKDVFVEKPLAATVGQAKELAILARKQKKILFVGHIFSHHSVLGKIQTINKRDPIKHAFFAWNKLGTFEEEILFNLASHDIATALEIFGVPKKVQHLVSYKQSPDILLLKLIFSKNRYCIISINRISSAKSKTVTFITERNSYVWENNTLSRLDKRDEGFKIIYQNPITPLKRECLAFINCLISRKQPSTDGSFGLEVVKVLAKI